jgi:hypothetical protein
VRYEVQTEDVRGQRATLLRTDDTEQALAKAQWVLDSTLLLTPVIVDLEAQVEIMITGPVH